MCFITSSWMFFKCSIKSSTSALLISPLSNYLNSKAFLGLLPYTIWSVDLPVFMLIELLYANSTYGKIKSQPFGLSPIKHLRKFPKIWFTTSIFPSIYGCCDKLNFKSILNFFHNDVKNTQQTWNLDKKLHSFEDHVVSVLLWKTIIWHE